MNYYNEIDPAAAQWIRNLIAAGHIPDGVVDERSIEDVTPADLAGFVQCHFFAGIAGWPLALRLAGWPSDRPIWTGSCPCQPFSSAGKGAGFADERHLWPAWQHLIAQCRPPVVFGEQVASKAVDAWIDLVHADMEGVGYAFGCVPFPSAGVGAPHIRDRTFWVGDADRARLEGYAGHGGAAGWQGSGGSTAATGVLVRVADSEQHGSGCQATTTDHQRTQADRPADQRGGCGSSPLRMANAEGHGFEWAGQFDEQAGWNGAAYGGTDGERPGPTNGYWSDADWLHCTDGKWRPVEPGTFPLAHGVSNRVVRLRAYGNAINPWQAAEFIRSTGLC